MRRTVGRRGWLRWVAGGLLALVAMALVAVAALADGETQGDGTTVP